MTWCNDCNDVEDRAAAVEEPAARSLTSTTTTTTEHTTVIAASKSSTKDINIVIKSCPSCGHQIRFQQEQSGSIHDLPGLPAGVKFDPTDQELLEHLEGKVRSDTQKLHPLIDEFIPTLEGENGICYTHPEKLPGVNKDGQIRHFFHRPSKAYTTGTRKRRKVHTDTEGGETRWHKTGKTRPVLGGGKVRGFKKILVLYTNYGKQRKPEKTNWVMHQYHLGNNEEEKDGELVVSKVFYQTQPRQCGSSVLTKDSSSLASKLKGQNGHNYHHLLHLHHHNEGLINNNLKNTTTGSGTAIVDFYNSSSSSYISFDQSGQNRANPSHQLIPHFAVNGGSSFIP